MRGYEKPLQHTGTKRTLQHTKTSLNGKNRKKITAFPFPMLANFN